MNFIYKILPNYSYKHEFVLSNYFSQGTTLVFYFTVANNLSKNDFALLAFFQLTSSIMRYFNLGAPFFIQNKILTKPKLNLPLVVGIHFQFYYFLFVLFATIFLFIFGKISFFLALLLIFYIVFENIFNYAELAVRSKGMFNTLVKSKILSSILTLMFLVLAFFDYVTVEMALIRYILVWLFSSSLLLSKFLSIDIVLKGFKNFRENSSLLLLFIKSSLPYGSMIYVQELFLVYPRLIVANVNLEQLAELSFGLTVVSNCNLGIASYLQIDYNSLYNFFLNHKKKYFLSESYKFIIKYFIIYSIFALILIFIVPFIFDFFKLFTIFVHLRVTFFIFISYYLVMSLLTPIQILVNINNANLSLSLISLIFLMLLSLFFFLTTFFFSNLLVSLAISYFGSLLIYGLIVLVYYERYYKCNIHLIEE